MKSISDSDNSGQLLKTVDRALTVLELLADSDSPLTVKELAEAAGLNVTTAYHIVNTLLARRYVTRVNGLVSLGPSTAYLAASFERHLVVDPNVQQQVDRVAQVTRETTYLGLWLAGRLVLSSLSEGSQAIRVSGLYVGFSGQEYRRASGRSVLAFLAPRELERYLESVSHEADFEEITNLPRVLDGIRHSGYALEMGEFTPGVACAAAPILDVKGRPLGALTVSAPVDRFQASVDSIVSAVTDAARQLSLDLGYRPDAASPARRSTDA